MSFDPIESGGPVTLAELWRNQLASERRLTEALGSQDARLAEALRVMVRSDVYSLAHDELVSRVSKLEQYNDKSQSSSRAFEKSLLLAVIIAMLSSWGAIVANFIH